MCRGTCVDDLHFQYSTTTVDNGKHDLVIGRPDFQYATDVDNGNIAIDKPYWGKL